VEVHPNILNAYFLLSVVGALSVALSFYLVGLYLVRPSSSRVGLYLVRPSSSRVGLYLVRPSSSRTNLWLLTRFVLRNDVCDFNLCACQ